MLITIRIPDDAVKLFYEKLDPNEDYAVQHPVTMGMIVGVEHEDPPKEVKE